MFCSTTRLALNDDYDFVQLRYPDGSLAHEVMWDHDPGRDVSISRNGDGPLAFSYDWLPTLDVWWASNAITRTARE